MKRISPLLLLAVCISSCDDGSSGEAGDPTEAAAAPETSDSRGPTETGVPVEADSESAEATAIRLTPVAGLPSVHVDADCAERDAVALCEYTSSIDALVFGVVTHIEASPHWLNSANAREALDSCNGDGMLGTPGLVIHLRVLQSSSRELAGDIRLYVGATWATLWSPKPIYEGSLEWFSTRPVELAPLVDETVGFFIQRHPSMDIWTTYNAMPMGSLHVPDREEPVVAESPSLMRACTLRPDLGVASLTAVELLSAVNACGNLGTDTDLQRGVDAFSSHAGMCHLNNGPADDVSCETDSDCPAGQLCDVLLHCVMPDDRTPIPTPD